MFEAHPYVHNTYMQVQAKPTIENDTIVSQTNFHTDLEFSHLKITHIHYIHSFSFCRLKKVLYGLKQAPRAWYARLDEYLQQQGFKRGSVDNNL